MKNRFCNSIIAAALTFMITPVWAHHSFAMFDQSKSLTLHGTVKDFRWSNPHVFIQLLASGQGSPEQEWSIEMTSPEHLARVGWKPRTLKAGDKITLVIHPMRDGVVGGQFLSGIGADGAALAGGATK